MLEDRHTHRVETWTLRFLLLVADGKMSQEDLREALDSHPEFETGCEGCAARREAYRSVLDLLWPN